jgi:hypothetical protein
VTVKPAALPDYQDADAGAVIDEADILGYWVYIPRYQYQVQRFSPSDPPSCGPAATNIPNGLIGDCSDDLARGIYGPRNFKIKFQLPGDPVYTPSMAGDWATHPVFEFTSGGITHHLSGLWVGKFETTGSSGELTIKPNQFSLRGQTLSLQYDQAKRIGVVDPAAESYGGADYLNNDSTGTIPQNQHGLTSVKTHMFTNLDWGAVVYLATSLYGVGDATYPDNVNNRLNEYGAVGKNANSAYVTGCGRNTSHSDEGSYSGGITCTSGGVDRSYYTTLGLESSTTGNVYGVYDMVGGAYEYTVSYFVVTDTTKDLAGFSVLPGDSYGIKYALDGGVASNFQKCTFATCGGQALYETLLVQTATTSSGHQSWSHDSSYFPWAGYPWADRGGSWENGSDSGLFNSDDWSGDVYNKISFRVGAATF